MQQRNLTCRRLEKEKAIVLDGHVPEVSAGNALDLLEVAEKPASQVDQVDALIHQLAAARPRGVGSPLLVVSDPPSVAVPAPKEHEFADRACRREVLGSAQRRMEAMIEANPDEDTCLLGCGDDCVKLLSPPSCRLLDEHVLSGRNCRECDLREQVMRGGDDDSVDIGPLDQRAPFGQHLRPVGCGLRKGFRPLSHDVGASHELGITQRASALPPHQTTADDADLHLIPSPSRDPWG